MAAKKNVLAPAVVQMLIGVIFPEQIINDMTQPVGISLHVNVRIHTAIVVNLAIMAVVPVVLNVRQVIHPALALHRKAVAINRVPRHARDNRVRHLHIVAVMAAHQPVVHNITVVHAVHRLQHAR